MITSHKNLRACVRAYHRRIRGVCLSVIVENEGGRREEKRLVRIWAPRLDPTLSIQIGRIRISRRAHGRRGRKQQAESWEHRGPRRQDSMAELKQE